MVEGPGLHALLLLISTNALQYNAAPLKSFALSMISRNVEEVMRTRGWKELILTDQGLLVEAFDSLARYNMELKNKLDSNP